MANSSPRRLSPFQVRWMMNFYPPLLFQGVRMTALAADFRSCRVRIGRRLWTRNLNGTTFGGSIFAGVDPFLPILYWQVFARRGQKVEVWLKGASIQYRKPAATALEIDFSIPDEELQATVDALVEKGKTVRQHPVQAIDRNGQICAEATVEVYIRLLGPEGKPRSGF
ncbi:MAG: DUF4442 domain-containing protein [Planctomycetota bacterium]|nr:MAG: DUF4442 domain-containing protein [Planctomycetota bacterium]